MFEKAIFQTATRLAKPIFPLVELMAAAAHIFPGWTLSGDWLGKWCPPDLGCDAPAALPAMDKSTANDSNSDNVRRQLAPILEEAMTRLSEKERTLVALRFFENKSAAETAVLLGIQEWAAHKRAARAVEKLRKFFTKRGVVLPAAVLTAAISANSVHAAPVALAKTVTAVAIAKGAATASTLTLVKGALKFMAWSKAKTAIMAGVGLLLAAGTGMFTVNEVATWRGEVWQRKSEQNYT